MMQLPTDFRAFMFLKNDACQAEIKPTQVLVCCDDSFEYQVRPQCLNEQGEIFFNHLQQKIENQNYDNVIRIGGSVIVYVKGSHRGYPISCGDIRLNIQFETEEEHHYHKSDRVVFLTDDWVYTLDGKLFKIDKD